MKAVKVINNPEAFRLLADETRRKILYLLRVKEMTVSQIAEDLNCTPQAVYHHIRKLLKGELVEVSREERLGHLIESYYRATAEMFTLHEGKASAQALRDKKLGEEQIATIFAALKKLGFNLEYNKSKFSQIVDLLSQLETGSKTEELETAVYEMSNLDFLTKSTVIDFAKALSLSDEEFAKQHENKKKFRKLLASLVKK
ncbi:MAG: winged helix-turn-helix transcriptional regulator [Candidatus Bathyarchaeota archaeon]|nr:MAG: winged helix-turn-helix transcriptional regulator [Candidatus Bathyarchaeota archaeon]